jgi:hypothetical protein
MRDSFVGSTADWISQQKKVAGPSEYRQRDQESVISFSQWRSLASRNAVDYISRHVITAPLA